MNDQFQYTVFILIGATEQHATGDHEKRQDNDERREKKEACEEASGGKISMVIA